MQTILSMQNPCANLMGYTNQCFQHSTVAEMPGEFQSDTIIITPNLVASILYEIWR